MGRRVIFTLFDSFFERSDHLFSVGHIENLLGQVLDKLCIPFGCVFFRFYTEYKLEILILYVNVWSGESAQCFLYFRV